MNPLIKFKIYERYIKKSEFELIYAPNLKYELCCESNHSLTLEIAVIKQSKT